MVLRRTGKVQSASHTFVFEEPTLQLRAEVTPTEKYHGTYRSLPSFFSSSLPCCRGSEEDGDEEAIIRARRGCTFVRF